MGSDRLERPSSRTPSYALDLLISYHKENKTYKLARASDRKEILHIPCQLDAEHTPEKRTQYIAFLEKAIQIQSLAFSNNSTLDIVKLIDFDKLPSILSHTADMAFHAVNLQHGDYIKFTDSITHDYKLKEICLRHIHSPYYKSGHYKARLCVSDEQTVIVRSCKLHNVLGDLSQKTISDLVAHEYSNNNERLAARLMTLAARLAFLGKIMDSSFVPADKL